MDIINSNPNKPWDWRYFSQNPNLTEEMINNNLDKPWEWRYVLGHRNVNIYMLKNIHKLRHPLLNPNLTMEFLLSDKGRNFYDVSSNLFLKDKNSSRYKKHLKYIKEKKKIANSEIKITKNILNLLLNYI
jgi:hypothetical protein